MSRPHRHRATGDVGVRPFFGPVSSAEPEPRAHGGICEVQRCACGAERRVNVNHRWVERGEWYLPEGEGVAS